MHDCISNLVKEQERVPMNSEEVLDRKPIEEEQRVSTNSCDHTLCR